MREKSGAGERAPDDGARRWRWLTSREWDRIAAASPGATPFHARAWTEALARSDGRFVARALGIAVEGPEPLLIPLALRRGSLRRGLFARAVSTHPGTYGGPIHAKRLLTPADWGALRAGLDELGLGRLEVFGNVLDPLPAEHAQGLETEERVTHVLALTRLAEDPLAGYEPSCRRAVRKAERAGVRVERLTHAEEVDEYVEAYHESLVRWKKPVERGYRRELFHDLLAAPGSELWAARAPDGRLAAGGVFLFAPRHVVYWHGAAREELRDARPANALMHRLIQEARARGAALFDFNPSSGLAGVQAFKESFGATPRTFLTWRLQHTLRRALRGRARHG
jgi:CelD/BcsL family acetyltransferase involved in cellulose biosynthesis